MSCSFTANSGNGTSDARDNLDGQPQDAAPDSPLIDAPAVAFVVDHLGVVAPSLLVGTIVIDVPTQVSDLQLVSATQTVGGGQISVLYFDTLIVNARFNMDGNKPVLLVGNRITINTNGGINAGANGIDAFAGGSDFTTGGLGGGGTGASQVGGTGADSGGGGGGFGTMGGLGGTLNQAAVAAGTAGPTYGTARVATMLGGSAGGDSACDSNIARGGAGGGALQLTARQFIILNGPISAAGGGGAAGKECNNDYDSGAGGGSGGLIFIQTPILTMNNSSGLYANGGGGGAAAQNVSPFLGTAGQNGVIGTTAAPGGVAANAQTDRNGGNGGVQGIAPSNGGNGNNSGGGGGAVGRIVIHGPTPTGGSFSPTPVVYN